MACMAMIRNGYRYANSASLHVLGAVLKLVVIAYFIFGALFLVLRYGVLPNIDYYKPQIEQLASRELGAQVIAGALEGSWRGLRPHFVLSKVIVHDHLGQPALILPKVSATLSWSSVLVADVRLHRLEISQPDMAIRRDQDGNLHVGGIFVDMRKEGDGRGLDWVLSQREIVVQGGRLSWHDEKRAAPPLALQDVDMVLRNAWRRHRFALKATPPASLAQPLDVRADFEHPRFASRMSDVSRWKGQLYADLPHTDLTAWKAFIDLPVELTEGQGAVRAWLHFIDAKIADFSADLSLENVSTRLRSDLPQLALARVDGRISVKEDLDPLVKDGTPTFGARGHAVSFTDFSFETRDGLIFPATTLSERFTPARGKQPEKFEVTAKLLDLHTLADFAERLPLAASQRQMLADFLPRGKVKDFSVQWEGSYPNLAAYRVKGQFVGLSMNPQVPRPARPKTSLSPAQAAIPAIPGFNNLTGSISATDQGGSFQLHSTQLKLQLPGYFSEPAMPFEKLDMEASWSFKEHDQLLLEIKQMNFVQEGLTGSLSGKHLMPLEMHDGALLGQIDLTARIKELELNKLGRYLPMQTPADTRTWLVGALEHGKAQNLAIRVKGNLADFPFRTERPARQPRGEFMVSGKLLNGRLNYDPGSLARDGKSPLWPKLEDFQGTLLVNNARMEIKADTAKTGNAVLSGIKAVLPDFLADDPVLEIEGNAAGALQDFVRYVNVSPVTEWISNFTDETKASGNARLALKLQLPLHRLQETRVLGSLQFLGNDITLFSALPILSGTHGKLEFSEHGFTLPLVKTNFLGGPASIVGSTQNDGTIMIKASGGLTADGIRKAYAAVPAMRRIGQRISGSTRYSAAVTVRKNGLPEIVVDSTLQGIGLDFPAPLNKAALESMPFKLEMSGKTGAHPSKARDEIKLSAGSAIAAYYEREKTGAAQDAWRVVRGGIGINVPAPQPDKGVIANISLRSLNVDEWRKLVAAIVGEDKAAANGTSDASDLAQYIAPETLAARATELIVAGKKLDNVVVGASYQEGAWQANIDSEQASGYVTWKESASGQGLGKVTARLASLTIPKSAASDVSDLLEGKQTSTQLPALDITVENFELFGKQLGHMELIANHAAGNVNAGSVAREWRINKLTINNPDGELAASGKWVAGESNNLTNLTYILRIANAGKLLERFGFDDVIRAGKGEMSGELSWKGLPFALDMPSLSGQVTLNIGAGQFLKGDPSAAKLLGLLSLQSLPRRLSLDFRDVFSEGFAFDGIVGSASIQKGIASTDNLKMRSLSVTVLMEGKADIHKETADLHVAIIPEINAGAASIVYGLAVNPVIGIGTFLAQLFLREPLMHAFTFEYQLTGPWKDPVITKLQRNKPVTLNPGAVSGIAPAMETAN